ncbi:MAG: putative minor capsid protein [Spirochaetales bacterium]|nr:putative minor capsid protein [Spirochaetales bacterium]
MIRPIHRKLLPHTVSFYAYESKSTKGVVTYGEEQTVSHVRVERTKKSLINSQGESKDDKLELYYDRRNSRPVNLDFTKFSKVVFSDQEYIVRESVPVYDDSNNIHHWEVALK